MMATNTRQLRRQWERAEKKAGKKVQGSKVAPTGEHGVEVDRDGERVLATFYIGYGTVTMSWARHDAKKVGEMIVEAAVREVKDSREEVANSGLVIAHSLPDSPIPS